MSSGLLTFFSFSSEERSFIPHAVVHSVTPSYYLRRRLASGEGIVSLCVLPSRCVCVRRISLDGEGNVLSIAL